MARKKSAAKKAREEAEKLQAQPQEATDDVSESSYSSSEEEDDYGELVTPDVEKGIKNVLEAIRNDPKKLLDKEVKFFDDSTQKSSEKKEKPMYLKDYHRENLLSGEYKKESDEYDTVDGKKPFVVEEKEEREKLLTDIHNAFSGDEDEDDFLTKKEKPTQVAAKQTQLPDPETDSAAFLEAFVDSHGWVPKKGDKEIDLDPINNDDEAEFDDAVEQFEHAYNFRYEDPNAAEIVSYARSQATLRRSKTNSRKRRREHESEIKHKELQEKEELVRRKKNSKITKVMDRMAQIKEAVGADVSEDLIQRVFGDALLNDDFDDTDWDNKMAEIFNEQYYGEEDTMEKPAWDDDLGESDDVGDADTLEASADTADVSESARKKSKKEKLKEKKSSKKDKEALKEKAREIVEANALKVLEEVEEERGRGKDKDELKFKYREVSPESFGLDTRDILLADDKQLNTYIGLKKFAPYRAKELRMKDKRKYAKRKNLFEWRKEVFKGVKRPEGEKDGEIWIPLEKKERKEKKKEKREKKEKEKE